MKRNLASLAIVLVLAVTAFAQTSRTSAKALYCNACCHANCGQTCCTDGCTDSCCQSK